MEKDPGDPGSSKVALMDPGLNAVDAQVDPLFEEYSTATLNLTIPSAGTIP
jgi:hypothetical protein